MHSLFNKCLTRQLYSSIFTTYPNPHHTLAKYFDILFEVCYFLYKKYENIIVTEVMLNLIRIVCIEVINGIGGDISAEGRPTNHNIQGSTIF